MRSSLIESSNLDYDVKKRKLENPVPREFGIREIPDKIKGIKSERKLNEPNVDIFKKKVCVCTTTLF